MNMISNFMAFNKMNLRKARKSVTIYVQDLGTFHTYQLIQILWNQTMTELVKLLILCILMNTALKNIAKATIEGQKLEKEVIEYLCAPENLQVIFTQCRNLHVAFFLSLIFYVKSFSEFRIQKNTLVLKTDTSNVLKVGENP